MPSKCLQELISLLELNGELSRIYVPANPVLEIAGITDRVCKEPDGGRALLFEDPVGSVFKLATNIFGSKKRVCLALGIENLDELTSTVSRLLNQIANPELESLGSQIAALPEFRNFAPDSSIQSDPDLYLMESPDLTAFPFLKSWPDDGNASGYGRYITLPQVFTTDPDGGTSNCGIYRVQIRSEREVAIRWKVRSGAARHSEQFLQAGKAMPVAIVLGGEPATLFSAMFPLPQNLDEMTFAGFIRGARLKTALCKTLPLQVPIGAEVVIEGYVEPGETVLEGPFGNHTGFYSADGLAAVMKVTAVSHRHNAIIPATVVGMPPMEDCWMMQAWERVLFAILRRIIPEIKGIYFPLISVFHQSGIIFLENPRPGMVRNIALQLWSMSWFASAKLLLFVSDETLNTDLSSIIWKSINVTDFSDDIIRDETTNRIAIDSTGCSVSSREIALSEETLRIIATRWKEYGLA
ncbi:MAG: UbiD family decarboxylase [Desulfuromonadaceae bacterium]|nr:UbiD family decarboxylase [Desulfuromonadaceae bacterium]MDD2854948.1 UbiD family decarboxylase [Desulfuromonadaceae bacterium]